MAGLWEAAAAAIDGCDGGRAEIRVPFWLPSRVSIFGELADPLFDDH